MRIVFAGTPEFAVPTLKALADAGHDVALVVTQPDRPAGRGRKLHPSPVKQFAVERGLPVIQPEDINLPESLGVIRHVAPDAIVVEAFGQKLSPEVLAAPRLGCFNVHASLLPAYRGAAPINRAVVRGEEKTGVTIIRMAERIDAGEILAQESVRIAPAGRAGDLSTVLAAMGARLMVETLRELEAGSARPIPQDAARASWAPRLRKDDGLIPWHKDARSVHNHIRGMTPWPGAFTSLRDGRTGKTVRVTAVKSSMGTGSFSPPGEKVPVPFSSDKAPVPFSPAPGTVVAADRRGLTVACGSGTVLVERVKPAGGREMSADEFARGHAVTCGSRFTSDE